MISLNIDEVESENGEKLCKLINLFFESNISKIKIKFDKFELSDWDLNKMLVQLREQGFKIKGDIDSPISKYCIMKNKYFKIKFYIADVYYDEDSFLMYSISSISAKRLNS